MENKKIQIIDCELSVCKVLDYSQVDMNNNFTFIGKTDEENSLVCPSNAVPQNATECDSGWKAFRISGVLDFSLIGVLSEISVLLADADIGIFAVSTFNTDYILTKTENFNKAITVLKNAGYSII